MLARHYRYGTVSVCVSVYYKSVFYESGWMVQAGFWHGGFLQPTTPCSKEIRVSTKIKELCLELRTYNIAMARWSSQYVVNLAQSSGRLAGKLDCRCSVGWKYLRWSTASLSHWLSVYVYSTTPCRGFFERADTRFLYLSSCCSSWLLSPRKLSRVIM